MKKWIPCLLLIAGLAQVSSSGYVLAKAHLSFYFIENAWEQTLKDQQFHKPWSWADTYPMMVLNFESINQKQYVLEGASGRNMAFSAAHLQASGMPGEQKSTVVSGHRDSHFNFLKTLNIGDSIVAKTRNSSISYKINTIEIIDSSRDKINIINKDELILTTCYPFDSLHLGGDLRFVIYAQLSS